MYLILGVSFWRVRYTLSRYVRTDCRIAYEQIEQTSWDQQRDVLRSASRTKHMSH